MSSSISWNKSSCSYPQTCVIAALLAVSRAIKGLTNECLTWIQESLWLGARAQIPPVNSANASTWWLCWWSLSTKIPARFVNTWGVYCSTPYSLIRRNLIVGSLSKLGRRRQREEPGKNYFCISDLFATLLILILPQISSISAKVLLLHRL